MSTNDFTLRNEVFLRTTSPVSPSRSLTSPSEVELSEAGPHLDLSTRSTITLLSPYVWSVVLYFRGCSAKREDCPRLQGHRKCNISHHLPLSSHPLHPKPSCKYLDSIHHTQLGGRSNERGRGGFRYLLVRFTLMLLQTLVIKRPCLAGLLDRETVHRQRRVSLKI